MRCHNGSTSIVILTDVRMTHFVISIEIKQFLYRGIQNDNFLELTNNIFFNILVKNQNKN